MKENKLKVSFFVQAKRTDKKGLVPVIGRISVGRTHSGFSTKCKTPPSLWDSRKQRLIGKSAMAVSVNQKLGECTALIHARFHELSEREESFTAADVRDAYQGQIHRQALLLESFGEYLTQTKERIGIDRALKTFKLRTYQLSLLREYVQKKHKVSDIPLSQLDKSFIRRFRVFSHHRPQTETQQRIKCPFHLADHCPHGGEERRAGLLSVLGLQLRATKRRTSKHYAGRTATHHRFGD